MGLIRHPLQDDSRFESRAKLVPVAHVKKSRKISICQTADRSFFALLAKSDHFWGDFAIWSDLLTFVREQDSAFVCSCLSKNVYLNDKKHPCPAGPHQLPLARPSCPPVAKKTLAMCTNINDRVGEVFDCEVRPGAVALEGVCVPASRPGSLAWREVFQGDRCSATRCPGRSPGSGRPP